MRSGVASATASAMQTTKTVARMLSQAEDMDPLAVVVAHILLAVHGLDVTSAERGRAEVDSNVTSWDYLLRCGLVLRSIVRRLVRTA